MTISDTRPLRQVMHELTADGRQRHYFRKQAGGFVCECGAEADKYGRERA